MPGAPKQSRNTFRSTILGGAACLYCVIAGHAEAARGAETKPDLRISDVGAVTDWRRGSDTVAYVQNVKGDWYRVDMEAPCMKLDTSKGVRFLTEVGEAGKYDVVEVAHHQCGITGITKASPPPR